MPAAKLFLKAADIAQITGSSLRSAQYLMTVFKRRGHVVYIGTSKKCCCVDVKRFAEYLSEQDGVDVNERKAEVMKFLRENRRST